MERKYLDALNDETEEVMEFIRKSNLKVNNTVVYDREYKQPAVCPYCGIYTDAKVSQCSTFPYDEGKNIIAVAFRCTSCSKAFLGLYIKDENELLLNSVVPVVDDEHIHKGLENISPRFVSLHRQAFRAEAREDYDVAALGYRTAIEVLLKDYAIKEQGKDREEMESMPLGRVISECVDGNAFKAADVIRIIGNDYAHFVNSHPDIDFKTFKYYYSMFLKHLEVEYDMKHPPVHR